MGEIFICSGNFRVLGYAVSSDIAAVSGKGEISDARDSLRQTKVVEEREPDAENSVCGVCIGCAYVCMVCILKI
jgi:hypothetical protein